MRFLKQLLGITALEEELKLRREWIERLAQGQIKVIDLALKQPELTPQEVAELQSLRIQALGITISGSALVSFC